MVDPSPTISRRALLVGTAGAVGVAVLAACGSSGSSEDGDDTGSDSTDTEGATSTNLLAIFPPEGLLVTGTEQRLPFTLADAEGAPLDTVPAELEFVVQTADGEPVGDVVTVPRHDQGIPTAYFPLVFTFTDAGDYQVTTVVDGQTLEPRVFRVGEPVSVAVPQPGQALPAIETPTTADARGVDPICTRDPDCDLHGITLTEALAAGTPVALIIATPEFCQTAICGPVLDVLLSQVDAFPDVTMVHAEVYKNPEAVDNIAEADLAPIIDTYSLSYEPVLYLANSDGTIAARLDTIFDEAEVAEALGSLS
jgi:hypothetical protein